jgi:hypothetical protein
VSQLHRRARPTERGKKNVVTDGALLRVSWRPHSADALLFQPLASTERIELKSRVPDGVMTTGEDPEKSTPIIVSRTVIVGVMEEPLLLVALTSSV